MDKITDGYKLVYEGTASHGQKFQVYGPPGARGMYKPDAWTPSEDHPGYLEAVHKSDKAIVRLLRPIRSEEEERKAEERFYKATADFYVAVLRAEAKKKKLE